MNNIYLRGIALSTLLSLMGGGYGAIAQAQLTPADLLPSVQEALSESGLDDIINQPDQLVTWVCQNGEKTVAVEVKELDDWQKTIEKEQTWQCKQNLPVIKPGDSTFSCETNETMGLITVFWLKGEGGKEEMTSWMNNLANDRNMVCTHGQSNSFWE